MSRSLVKKPGFMLRAVVAWFIYNAILVVTLGAVVWLLPEWMLKTWYVTAPMIVAIIISEWVIMTETIAPVVRDWINQTEWKED